MPDVAAPPAGQQPESTGQSPPGASPATMAVPNRGQEAAGLALISNIVDALLKLVPQVGAGSDVGKDVLKAATMLSKHVPPGSTSPGVKNAAMQNMMREHQAQQPMAAMMAAKGGGAPPAPGAQPAAAA